MQSAMDHHIINIARDVTPASQRKQRRNVTRRRQRLQRPETIIAPILLAADAEIEGSNVGGGADLLQIEASVDVDGYRTKSGCIAAKEINGSNNNNNNNNKGRNEIERNSKNEGGNDDVTAAESCSTAEATDCESGVVRRRQTNRNSGGSTLNSSSTSCVVSCASAMGEEHRVISTEYRAAATQAIMKVTILAAGFVIGSRGISARLIGQATGAVVHSWTEYGGDRRNSVPLAAPPAPVRLFRIDGKKSAVQAAVSLIHDAVSRYKQLCDSKRRGEFVQREQIINGVEFYYQPPPRKAFISVSIPMTSVGLVTDGTPRNPSAAAAANRPPPPPPPPHHLQSQAPPPFRIDASPTPPPRNWLAPSPSPAPAAVALSPPSDGIRATASAALRRPPFLSWPPLRRPQCRDPTAGAVPPPPMHDLLICSLRRPSQPPMSSSQLLNYYMNHPGLRSSSPLSAAGAMKSPRSTTSTAGNTEAIRPQFSVEHFLNTTSAPKESRPKAGVGLENAQQRQIAADCSLFSAFGQPDILAHQRPAEKVGVSESMAAAGGGEACARTAFEFTACDFLRKSLPPYVLMAAGTSEEQYWAGEYCLFGGSPSLVEHQALGSLGGGVERMSAAPEASGSGGVSAVESRQPPWL